MTRDERIAAAVAAMERSGGAGFQFVGDDGFTISGPISAIQAVSSVDT